MPKYGVEVAFTILFSVVGKVNCSDNCGLQFKKQPTRWALQQLQFVGQQIVQGG